MNQTILTAKNLTKSYGDLTVFSDLSFEIPEGEIYGLIGPNGAGKTTLINLMTGQDTPSSGTVTIDDVTVSENPLEIKQRIGILPEKQSPFSVLTPREVFHFAGQIRGLSEETVEEEMEYWAEKLQFTEFLDTVSTDLSRGNQQKVMITQAMIHNPDILFIDEPVANLDPFIQHKLKDVLREYNERGNTIVLSTHHLEFARDLCSKALFVSDSEVTTIAFDKTDPEELLERFTGDI
jgi:ABC-2 type transport system ATP-binding protein